MKRKVGDTSTLTTNKRKDNEDIRTGLGADAIAKSLIDNLHHLQGDLLPVEATRNDWTWLWPTRSATAYRTAISKHSQQLPARSFPAKVVACFSAECPVEPHLGNGPANLGIWEAVQEVVPKLGQDLGTLLEKEQEPGLGNGGLGRLAACYNKNIARLMKQN